MAPTTQNTPITAVPQVREDHAEAILHLLGAAEDPNWPEIAAHVIRDPALMHAALPCLTDVPDDSAFTMLRTGLATRVETLLRSAGADLLRIWLLLGMWPHTQGTAATTARAATDALIFAECARHLAIETRYPHPDEAYLAGLFHACAHEKAQRAALTATRPAGADAVTDIIPGVGVTARPATPQLRLLSPALVDALSIGTLTDEQCLTAHPLLRIVHCTRLLVRHDWGDAASRIVNLTGLRVDALASLRADTHYLAGGPLDAPPPTGPDHEAREPAPSPLGSAVFRDAALSGLLKLVFDSQPEETIATRYRLACHLLGGVTPPLLLAVESNERLQALPLGIDPAAEAFFDELGVRLEDEASVIALTARSARASSWVFDSHAVSRSLIDMQMGRRFGPAGFDCIPLDSDAVRGVAMRRRGAAQPACGEALMASLCRAALNAWSGERARRAAREELADSVAQRFREQARKLAHEANNPLTIIRSHLEVMSQQHRDTAGLGSEIATINTEIDRLTNLVRELGNPPAPQHEPAHCALASLLDQLRTVYAPTLFDQRGIQFELRVAHGLPDAAMPASKLKQVIINLFRNASEALQPGCRFSVVVPGQLISNGVPCIEIRIIDNGPGLPRERLVNLFAPHSTTKGGDHQGLGLSLVGEILAEFGAYILCRSQPGAGTSFQILVPTLESS